MEKIIIEVYSLLLLIILFFDYYKQNKNNSSINKKEFILIQVGIFIFLMFNIFVKLIVKINSFNEIFIVILLFLSTRMLSYINSKFLLGNLDNKRQINKVKVFSVSLFIGLIVYEFILNSTTNKDLVGLLFVLLPLFLLLAMIIKRRKKDKSIPIFPIYLTMIIILGNIIDYIITSRYYILISYMIIILIYHLYKNNKKIYDDQLTGINNRKVLDMKIYDRILDTNNMVGVYLIDIDRFKKINDNMGHVVGDEVLKLTANILKETVRKTDYVIRYGGDEFLLIVGLKKETDLECVYKRILKQFEDYNINSNTKIDISIGYDFYLDKNTDFNCLINSIDKKMYIQKKSKQ